MFGAIGGFYEEKACERIGQMKTPVFVMIGRMFAPPGKRMGHAGAIIGGKDDTADAKKTIMRDCGIHVVNSPADIGKKMAELLN